MFISFHNPYYKSNNNSFKLSDSITPKKLWCLRFLWIFWFNCLSKTVGVIHRKTKKALQVWWEDLIINVNNKDTQRCDVLLAQFLSRIGQTRHTKCGAVFYRSILTQGRQKSNEVEVAIYTVVNRTNKRKDTL